MEKFYVLILVMVYRGRYCQNSSNSVHKMGAFIICQLYFSEGDLKDC